MKVIITCFLLLFSLSAKAEWRVEKIKDKLFDTTTIVISTASYADLYGNSILIKYAFVCEKEGGVSTMLSSSIAVFAVEKVVDTTGDKLATVLMKLDNREVQTFEFFVDKGYKFIWNGNTLSKFLIQQNVRKTMMRFNIFEDKFDATFRTQGLDGIVKKNFTDECKETLGLPGRSR